MCAAHLLIMLYLSVKFHQFCFSCIYIYIKFQKMFHSSDHEKSEREREREMWYIQVYREIRSERQKTKANENILGERERANEYIE